MMRLFRMLSGLLSAVFGRRAEAEKPVRRLAAEVKTSGWPDNPKLAVETEVPPHDYDAWRGPPAASVALSGLRRLFRGRGINVRGDRQLLVATEEVCRELDAIRAQVGEQLLRDMGLADCGTPGSDEMPGWSGHDDD